MLKTVSGVSAALAAALLAAGCGTKVDNSGSSASSAKSAGTTASSTSNSASTKTEGGFPVYAEDGWKGQTYEEQTKIIEKDKGAFPKVSGSTTRGVTKDAIKIEGVITKATAQGAVIYPGVCEAAEARFERANREGGVNGRKIDFGGCKDDGGDPARNTSLAQEAVERDKAFAVVPANSVAPGGFKYLNKNHVIYSGAGVAPQELGDPFAFPAGGPFTFEPVKGQVIAYPQFGAYAKAFGTGDPKDLKVAFVADDQSYTPLVANIAKLHAEKSGSEVVYSTTSLPGPTAAPLTDYTTIVSQIKAKKPNVIWVLVSNPQTVAGLVAALKGTGTPPEQIIQANFTDDRIFENPQLAQAMDGTVAFGPTAMPGNDAEGVKMMQKDLEAIGKKAPVGGSSLNGYAAADFLVWALKNHKGELTTEALANELNKGTQYPGVPGAVCGLNLPLHHYTQPPCLSFAQVNANGKTFDTKLPVTLIPTELTPSK